MSETETPVVEVSKPSKLARVRNIALTAGTYMVPTAVAVGVSVVGYKASLNNLSAANIILEASKVASQKA